MKKFFTIAALIMYFIFNTNLITSAATMQKEGTDFWYKGYGISTSYSTNLNSPTYTHTNYEWAVVTAHAHNDQYGNAVDRVRTLAREESPTYAYGSTALVRTLKVTSGLKDQQGTEAFIIKDMTPIEQTLSSELKPAWYDLLGLVPWKGADTIVTASGYVLDAVSNIMSASINHWYDTYKKKGQVRASHWYDIDNINLENTVAARDTDNYADYAWDNRGLGKGFTSYIHYNYGGVPNYTVRAYGQVVYRVQTENGNGLTYDVMSGIAVKDHLINAQ